MILGFYLSLAALVVLLLAVLEFRFVRARRRGLTDSQLQAQRDQGTETPDTGSNIRGENVGPWNGPGNTGGY